MTFIYKWLCGNGHGGKRAVTTRLVDSWQSPRYTDIPIEALITNIDIYFLLSVRLCFVTWLDDIKVVTDSFFINLHITFLLSVTSEVLCLLMMTEIKLF